MVKKILLSVMLMMMLSFAHAEPPITKAYYNYGTFYSPSPEAVCEWIKGQGLADINNSAYRFSRWAVEFKSSSGDQKICQFYAIRISDSVEAISSNFNIGPDWTSRCADGSAPNTSNPLAQQCVPATCPYGQMKIGGVCEHIQCGEGSHFGADPYYPTLHRCIPDCPANTISNINPNTHLQVCAPFGNDEPEKSDTPECGAGQIQVGFDGQGKAICMRGPDNDGCPEGTTDVGGGDAPNCYADQPPKPETTKDETHPEKTTSNSDGSTTKTNQNDKTFPDGSTLTTITKTTTKTDGSTTTETTSQCSKAKGCGSSAGSANPGSGSGGGGGDGGGEGEGSGASLDGDLYTKKDKTFGGVFKDFTDKVKAAPFITAGQNFFTVSVGGGSCPSWSASVPYLEVSINLGDYICSPGMISALSIAAAGLLIGAAYVAFRMAFL